MSKSEATTSPPPHEGGGQCHVALILGRDDLARATFVSETDLIRFLSLADMAKDYGLTHLSLFLEEDTILGEGIKNLAQHAETKRLNASFEVVDKDGITSKSTPPADQAEIDVQVTIVTPQDAKEEFVGAVRKLAKEGTDISGGAAPARLSESIRRKTRFGALPDPDLIVYFGGRKNLSKLGIWVAAYAEFAFLSEPWHSFTADGLGDLLSEFGLRERRFGAVKS